MSRIEFTKGVTPVGTAYWSHLISTEQFQNKDTNKFAISLRLSPKDEKDFLNKINAEWEKFKESSEGQKHKYKYEPTTGFKQDEDGDGGLFKFKMTAVIHTRSGRDWERHVPVYDAGCKEISGNMEELGNGSKVKVAYELVPFFMSDKNYGISLRLTAVQVLEFKSSEETAESFGFGQEEGFHAEDKEEDVVVPFDVESSEGVDDF